jgi:hypothetical protein
MEKLTITISGFANAGQELLAQIISEKMNELGLTAGIQGGGGRSLNPEARVQVLNAIKHQVVIEIRATSAVRPEKKTSTSGQ